MFEFTDVAPKIFEQIRLADGIDNNGYIESLGPANIFQYIWSNDMKTFVSLCSSGKSGSLFYYTEDGKYMLKTIFKHEYFKIQKILKGYHQHLM